MCTLLRSRDFPIGPQHVKGLGISCNAPAQSISIHFIFSWMNYWRKYVKCFLYSSQAKKCAFYIFTMFLFIFFSAQLLKTDNIIIVIIAGQKAASVHFLGGNWGPPLLSLAAQGMGKVSITNINISVKVLITIIIMTILIIKLNPL